MSDTPKTDSSCFELESNCCGGLDKVVWGHNLDRYVCVEFARELERENNKLREALYEIANHGLDARQCMLLAKSALPNQR